MRMLVALLLLACLAPGQDAEKKKDPEKRAAPPKLEPLPPGKVRVFKAIVIQVQGIAQARRPVKVAKEGEKTAKPKWQKLQVNDVLEPGAVVRTGRKSQVTLRIGVNATMIIERQSRVAIPEIAQKGKVLRTRVSIGFGKADVKVDRLGLDNDFEVTTPTATLAVRGTVFRIWWDVVNGFRALGVPGNKIRAIEVTYLNGVKAHLSKADSTTEAYRLPALDAFYETYLAPLEGALSTGEHGDRTQDPSQRTDLQKSTGLDATNASRNKTKRAQG